MTSTRTIQPSHSWRVSAVNLGTGSAAVFEVTSEPDDEEFAYASWTALWSSSPPPAGTSLCGGLQGPFDEVRKNAREAANRSLDTCFG
jgi:hypothetical protein